MTSLVCTTCDGTGVYYPPTSPEPRPCHCQAGMHKAPPTPVSFRFDPDLPEKVLRGTAGRPEDAAVHITHVGCVRCGFGIPVTPGVTASLARAGLAIVGSKVVDGRVTFDLRFDRSGTIFTPSCPACGLGAVVIHAEPGQAPVARGRD